MQMNALNNPMNDDMNNRNSFLLNVSDWFNDECLEPVGDDGAEDDGDDREDEGRESGRSDLVVVIFLSNFSLWFQF